MQLLGPNNRPLGGTAVDCGLRLVLPEDGKYRLALNPFHDFTGPYRVSILVVRPGPRDLGQARRPVGGHDRARAEQDVFLLEMKGAGAITLGGDGCSAKLRRSALLRRQRVDQRRTRVPHRADRAAETRHVPHRDESVQQHAGAVPDTDAMRRRSRPRRRLQRNCTGLEAEAFEEGGQCRARVGRGCRENAAVECRLSHLAFRFAADLDSRFGSGLVKSPVSRV